MSSPDFRLPDLRFVATDAIYPHEWNDPQRTQPLVAKLERSGVLKNPPIVVQVGDGQRVETRYVVLDGANRSTAARVAGWPHVLVQVVRYEEPWVQLSTWYHALTGGSQTHFEDQLGRIAGLEHESHDKLHARAMLARREALACVAHTDGHVTVLRGGRSLHERNLLLNAIVNCYQNVVPYIRVTTDSLQQARLEHPDVTSLVVFPRYDPAEVIELASAGEHLPAGITRHLIQWRALRIQVPLDLCRDTGRSEAEKNVWLRAFIDDRLRGGQVRFYEEPTVQFDE